MPPGGTVSGTDGRHLFEGRLAASILGPQGGPTFAWLRASSWSVIRHLPRCKFPQRAAQKNDAPTRRSPAAESPGAAPPSPPERAVTRASAKAKAAAAAVPGVVAVPLGPREVRKRISFAWAAQRSCRPWVWLGIRVSLPWNPCEPGIRVSVSPCTRAFVETTKNKILSFLRSEYCSIKAATVCHGTCVPKIGPPGVTIFPGIA